MITVKNLSVTINQQQALDTVSCTLIPGHITLFIGKSGAGKTTLLQSIAGLVNYQAGTILFNDTDIRHFSTKERAQHIGYVFQQFNLFPHLTALQNCIDPQLVRNIPFSKAQEIALEQLESLDMIAHQHKYPHELSGGQQQRIAIARALCLKPTILLLDEPTASLDPVNAQALTQILERYAQQGLTIGLSSQDMNFVHKLFDRVYYLENGSIKEFCEDKESLDKNPIIKTFIT